MPETVSTDPEISISKSSFRGVYLGNSARGDSVDPSQRGLGRAPGHRGATFQHLIVAGDEQPRRGHLVLVGTILSHNAIAFVDDDFRR